MNWQLWTRPFGSFVFLWMGLGLLGLTVLLMGGAAAARDRDRQIVHTLEVLQHLERYESGILQADVRSRNAFQSKENADAALNGLQEAQQSIERLMTLTGDNPRQTIRVKVLQSLTNQAAGTIRARVQAGAMPILGFDNPLSALPVAETVNEIRSEERKLLVTRERERSATDIAFWRLTAFGITLNLGFIWWAYRASRRYILERNEREFEISSLNHRLGDQVTEIRNLNATLEERIHERTAQLEATVRKLQSSNAELERFAYIASHDLQEPLRQVASFNSLLTLKYGAQLDENARRYLSYSVAGAKRLQLMLQGLLQYTLISTSPLRRTEIGVSQLVDSVRQDLRTEIAQSGAVFDIQAQEGLTIFGDPQMLRTVASALVSNAIRFRRPDTPPEITIAFERNPAAWILTVTDNGIGVEPRFSERIFEMFARYHSVGEYSGAGAGLAISKKIVQLHGGSLTAVTGEDRQGACFKVTIPLKIDEEKPLETMRFPY
jgi:signal transduction histidine kinase